MKRNRPAIFRGRHFEPEIIATCVRWYLRFSLSLRNVEEMMAERGRMVDHTNGLALVSKVRSGDLSPVARKAEIHDHHLAYGRNLRSDRRPVGVSVPCGRQPRRHRGLLFVGNTRSWGGQNVSAEGSIESGRSNSTPAVHGPVPDLPRSDSRFASRRAFTAEVLDQTIRKQSN